jgi:ABC-type nickel/cobalt efflux system permease component RcnA
MSDEEHIDRHDRSARKSARFFLICSGLLIAIIVIFAFAMRLEIFSAGPHVVFAMVLGVFFTIVLGVGLMALAFHSDDSGIDDQR